MLTVAPAYQVDRQALAPAHSVFDVPGLWMAAAHLAGGMIFHRSDRIVGELTDLAPLVPAGGQVLCSQLSEPDLVWSTAVAMVRVAVAHGSTRIEAVAADRVTVDRVVEETKALAQALLSPPPPSTVPISLWWCGDRPASIVRAIDADSWSTIAAGYPSATRADIAALMTLRSVEANLGRLVMWHGPPGTGKSTAVRALAREWSSWCDVHYVSDPERLFAVPGYLLTVAGDLRHRAEDDRWRLIVAEDCDEYLRSDAKDRAGASLGRLLNLSDGILGNGLRALVLLTTNEDLGRLHPAITRPGRCLSQVEFARFNREEASRWLGSDVVPTSDAMTLAELFALRRNGDRPGLRAEVVLRGGYV